MTRATKSSRVPRLVAVGFALALASALIGVTHWPKAEAAPSLAAGGCTGDNGGPRLPPAKGSVIKTNFFTVAPENQQRLLEILTDKTLKVTCKAPGLISHTLYRGLDGDRVLAFIVWRSPEDFQAFQARAQAQRRPEDEELSRIAKLEQTKWEVFRTFR